MDMKEKEFTDKELDFVTMDAIAYLYGQENSDLAKDEFDSLVKDAREKLEDESFMQKLRNLKPKGQVTVSILFQYSNDDIQYISRLKFTIRKSQSRQIERYYLDVGAAFRDYEQYYPFHFKELWICNRACGKLDAIKKCINDPVFMNETKEELCNLINEKCWNSYLALMTDDDTYFKS